jgi:hypothetical protein
MSLSLHLKYPVQCFKIFTDKRSKSLGYLQSAKRNRNETKRNETKPIKTKRNQTKRNEMIFFQNEM